jgi:hypothetical protein
MSILNQRPITPEIAADLVERRLIGGFEQTGERTGAAWLITRNGENFIDLIPAETRYASAGRSRK